MSLCLCVCLLCLCMSVSVSVSVYVCQDTQQLFHPISGQCLDCDAGQHEIFMQPCDSALASQRWKWGHVNVTVARIEWTAPKDRL